jgi:4-hydroxybenzoyl-CoA thioesterase
MTTSRTFKHTIPVSFGDVDYARIMYYPRLFHFCHAVMEAFFDGVGLNYARLLVERKIGFPTVHTEADYKVPMPYGIVLEFELSIRALGTTSISFEYVVRGAGEQAIRAEARTTVVCIDMDRFEKKPLPPDIRRVLSGFLVV